MIEHFETDGARRQRAFHDKPSPVRPDGTILVFGAGNIPMRSDEWFMSDQVVEIFIAFMNGKPLPASIHWRPAPGFRSVALQRDCFVERIKLAARCLMQTASKIGRKAWGTRRAMIEVDYFSVWITMSRNLSASSFCPCGTTSSSIIPERRERRIIKISVPVAPSDRAPQSPSACIEKPASASELASTSTAS